MAITEQDSPMAPSFWMFKRHVMYSTELGGEVGTEVAGEKKKNEEEEEKYY